MNRLCIRVSEAGASQMKRRDFFHLPVQIAAAATVANCGGTPTSRALRYDPSKLQVFIGGVEMTPMTQNAMDALTDGSAPDAQGLHKHYPVPAEWRGKGFEVAVMPWPPKDDR